jgi:heat shock protein HspQ
VSEHRARFSVGQVVHHRLFDYRGIIFDVDATFEGTDAWYEEIATSRPPKDRPWYHVLVDGETHTTYVAEQNLEPSSDEEEIEHPLFEELFHRDASGNWIPQQDVN